MGILGKHDVEAGPWSIEVKDRKKFIGVSFLEQACRNCPKDKTPLVIVHQTNKAHEHDIVMMRLSDFQDWFNILPKF